jgi:hypothetical protein
VLKSWIAHFNHARPHISLGRGCLRHPVSPRRKALIGTVFLRTTRLGGLPFSADSIMNTGSKNGSVSLGWTFCGRKVCRRGQ